jgi:hypothetical protein
VACSVTPAARCCCYSRRWHGCVRCHRCRRSSSCRRCSRCRCASAAAAAACAVAANTFTVVAVAAAVAIARAVVNAAAATHTVAAGVSVARICNRSCGSRHHRRCRTIINPISSAEAANTCTASLCCCWACDCAPHCHMLRSCALTCSVTVLGLPEGCVTPSQRVSAHMLRAGLNPGHVLTLPLYAPSQTRLSTRQGLTTSGPGGNSGDMDSATSNPAAGSAPLRTPQMCSVTVHRAVTCSATPLPYGQLTSLPQTSLPQIARPRHPDVAAAPSACVVRLQAPDVTPAAPASLRCSPRCCSCCPGVRRTRELHSRTPPSCSTLQGGIGLANSQDFGKSLSSHKCKCCWPALHGQPAPTSRWHAHKNGWLSSSQS